MRFEIQRAVKLTQDNYGRWFVEVQEAGRKRPPIRCFTEQEARITAERMRCATVQEEAA